MLDPSATFAVAAQQHATALTTVAGFLEAEEPRGLTVRHARRPGHVLGHGELVLNRPQVGLTALVLNGLNDDALEVPTRAHTGGERLEGWGYVACHGGFSVVVGWLLSL